ncbi:MAG: type II secretion system F family protein [Butyrivibrio sp.]|uniref:type II secretion system F family protein n=1 Tax=Butyrivibrio sp. TaxID=28121 RepID=UPI001B1F7D41|nr:type II secretion system F family protein [Butyrivibrio sp.]MBO6240401.1 type II secretion system F family protein [Butyrivibrio sp.]
MKKKIKATPLNSYEISSFCRQLALLLRAGIAPSDSIEILTQDTEDPSAKEILSSINQVLRSGEKFHVALKMSGVFPDYVSHMVTIGEESGNIDVVMDSLADYYDREENIQSGIKNAISYPLIMVFMMLVVVVVLVLKVLPIFEQVYEQLGTNMSGFSQSLLNLGNLLNRYSVILVCFLVILAIVFFYISYTVSGRNALKKFIGKFAPTKKLMQELECERFASGMVLTLSSGMDTFEGLSLVKKLVETNEMKEKIDKCKELLIDGASFPEALLNSKIFTSFYAQMIDVGFKSGSMDKAMKQIADRFEHETQRKIISAISVIEPTLVIILSIIVGMILLSVILPLMGIMTTIG